MHVAVAQKTCSKPDWTLLFAAKALKTHAALLTGTPSRLVSESLRILPVSGITSTSHHKQQCNLGNRMPQGQSTFLITNDNEKNSWNQSRGYAIVHTGATASQLLPDTHPLVM